MDISQQLKKMECDGWLAYDFRRSNGLACKVLSIPSDRLLTRRFFYWVPSSGEPVKIVHAIEPHVLSHLPGRTVTYRTWEELEAALGDVLKGKKNAAMEYSPKNSNPYISKVDAGTVELVRSFGVDVISSGDLIQNLTSVLTPSQIRAQQLAGEAATEIMSKAWEFIGLKLAFDAAVNEWDVQQFISEEISKRGFVSDVPALCAVNGHSADPHYTAEKGSTARIHKGDFILIDLGCKLPGDEGIYADITHVAVADNRAKPLHQELFDIVKKARDAACTLVVERFDQGLPLQGCEIDRCARTVIEEAGYGDFFIHRTGHNIGVHEHGDGAHLDSYETQDTRLILPGSCFSIEPGIYLPGQFGVRLEHDVLVHPDGEVEMTGGMQQELRCLFAD